MSGRRMKARIALDAAKLLLSGEETDASAARSRAVQALGIVPQARQLPSFHDIRRQLEILRREGEIELEPANRRERALTALKLMWELNEFGPRLDAAALRDDFGPPADALGGPAHSAAQPTSAQDDSPASVRSSAADPPNTFPDPAAEPIILALGTRDVPAVVRRLNALRLPHTTKPTRPGESDCIRFQVRTARGHGMTFEIVFSRAESRPGVASPSQELDVGAVEDLVRRDYPDANLSDLHEGDESWADPALVFRLLLQRLEGVKQKPEHHPEGDALYHSLQAFDLAREQFPYDEEFLLAALLHDVGKGIDPAHHIEAGLDALRGLISPRTTFLIEYHSAARHLKDGSLNGRLRSRLLESPWHDDLMALHEVDNRARRPGVPAPTIDEALDYLVTMGNW